MPTGSSIAAVPGARRRPRRACARDGLTLDELPAGARVGTGSPRRRAQLLAARPDLDVVDIRGNVDTRLGRMSTPTRTAVDAVVLAAAGLDTARATGRGTELLDLRAGRPRPRRAPSRSRCAPTRAPRCAHGSPPSIMRRRRSPPRPSAACWPARGRVLGADRRARRLGAIARRRAHAHRDGVRARWPQRADESGRETGADPLRGRRSRRRRAARARTPPTLAPLEAPDERRKETAMTHDDPSPTSVRAAPRSDPRRGAGWSRRPGCTPPSWCCPMFVREGATRAACRSRSMPGVVQHTLDSLKRALADAAEAGVGGVMLFGVPEHKDAIGSGADRPRRHPQRRHPRRRRRGGRRARRADRPVPRRVHRSRPLRRARRRRARRQRRDARALPRRWRSRRRRPGRSCSGSRGMMDGQVAAVRDALDAHGHHRRRDPRLRREVRLRVLRAVPRGRAVLARGRPPHLPARPGEPPRGRARGRRSTSTRAPTSSW